VLRDCFLAFVPIFVAVDALGMVPVFLGLTDGMKLAERQRLVSRAVPVALIVALGFLFIGKLVFNWLDITISDFLVAGGAILFIISIRDLLSNDKSSRLSPESAGVVPLAVPLIVGPAVLASSLILLDSFGLWPTLFSIVSNILLCGLILRSANRISTFLGVAGSQALSKVASLLLAAIGIMLVRRGIFEMFS
jgi:multiple antibiotic resistance protein